MPLGIERINVRTAQPNPNINFIKPLESSHKAHAQDFLERVAAICVPIMKRNHIYVMSLEEFPPNNEFLGRNFNAGEKIQLVLKNKMGGWLPFKFVQRVMMHELAHCKQMNHSKFFWQVNNQHCAELKELWDKGYTGEGMWSKGISLESGNYVRDRPLMEGEIPHHLCGGTFRSNRKRKRGAPAEKEKISYQERQQRRIAKKFGTNGVALGADDEVKATLEKGKRPKGKPRVAGSARGRELRAAAALARFEKPQVPELDDDIETEFEEDDLEMKPDDAKDIFGNRLLDSNGGGMIKVCEDEDNNEDAQREMDELRNLDYVYGPPKSSKNKAVVATHDIQNLGAAKLDSRPKSYASPYASPWSPALAAPLPKVGHGYGESSKRPRLAEKQNLNESTSGYREYARGLRNPATSTSTSASSDYSGAWKTSTQTTTKDGHRKDHEINKVKLEVFDILCDYLGDPTCNPDAAIYSGLEAAKASMPRKKPEPAEEELVETANRGVKRDSRGFARAVQGHRREETIGITSTLPPPNPLVSDFEREQQRRRSLMGSVLTDTRGLVEQIRGNPHNAEASASGRPLAVYASRRGASRSQARQVSSVPARASSPVPSYPSSQSQGSRKTRPPLDLPVSSLPLSVYSSQQGGSRSQAKPVSSVPAQSSSPAPSYSSSQRQSSRTARQPPPPVPNVVPPRVANPPPRSAPAPRAQPLPPPPPPVVISTACKVCTTVNEPDSLVCMVCTNVLYPERDPLHWKCKSAACQGTEYINSGDYGVCGVCGEKKPGRK